MFAFLKEYNTRSEKALLALLIIAICQETLFIYPVAIISHLSSVLSGIRYVIFPITYLILTIIALQKPEATRYIRVSDFLLIAFFSLYVFFSLGLNPKQTEAVLEILRPIFLPCIPFLFLGLCVKIDSVSMDALGKWSCCAIIITSVYRILYQAPDVDWEYNYNMGAAYALLPNILIAIDYLFRTKKKLIPIVCSVVGVFYLFAMGTRGPIVIAFSLLFIRILTSINLKRFWMALITVLFGSIVIWLSTSPALINILAFLGNILSSMGLSSRATDFGVSGEFISNTTGRDEITEILLSKLGEMPLLGYGVMGENRFDILSAHNLFLEAIFDYGYFFGGLILLFFIVITVKSILKTRGKPMQQWIIIWTIYVFVKGFFGGGVLRPENFILIGICLRSIRMKLSEIQY